MAQKGKQETWKSSSSSTEEGWFFDKNQQLLQRLRDKKAQLKLIQGGKAGPMPEADGGSKSQEKTQADRQDKKAA
jgi:hypothetical protein